MATAVDPVTACRVEEGAPLNLGSIDPHTKAGAPGGKKATKRRSDELRAELKDLQARLYAEGEQSLLVVLQALDTGGKDSTIRRVFARTNAQGVKVASFGRPTELELAHDFLWRVHHHAPAAGDIAIFNRSHYEDVLVARVHDLVPRRVWQRRYDHIRHFEELLTSRGTRVVKLFLHISREEQRERLQSRLDKPAKHWKWQDGDLDERARWDDYQGAFRDALVNTTTEEAPWYVVPADRKWYRDWVVLSIVVGVLRDMNPRFPPGPEDLDGITIPA